MSLIQITSHTSPMVHQSPSFHRPGHLFSVFSNAPPPLGFEKGFLLKQNDKKRSFDDVILPTRPTQPHNCTYRRLTQHIAVVGSDENEHSLEKTKPAMSLNSCEI